MPPPPRVAAVDLGKSRAGLAISDELGFMAHSRGFLDAKSRKSLLANLVAFVREEKVDKILVGLPLEMSGERGAAASRSLQFAQELANATGIDVELVDERLTTVEATRHLRAGGVSAKAGKALVDGVAAAVILQSWLDR